MTTRQPSLFYEGTTCKEKNATEELVFEWARAYFKVKGVRYEHLQDTDERLHERSKKEESR
jgi:hypothetical protein